MLNKLKGLFIEEDGQGMTEYAIVLGVIAVGVVAIITLFGKQITAMFKDVTDSLTDVSGVSS
ncbi:Flp family type IVb pilin [Radiobacillus sp. PE A8.2]|uniref:Flp family type IVb pilin n=1 Tax=Radiobacillus sp. PE A8.2 TaxID=3380349 RepID=UPI00388F2351